MTYNNLATSYNLKKQEMLYYKNFYENDQERYLNKPHNMASTKWANLAKVTVAKCESVIDRLVGWVSDGVTITSSLGNLDMAMLNDIITNTYVEGTVFLRIENIEDHAEYTVYPADSSFMIYDSYMNPLMFYSQYQVDGYTLIEIFTADYVKKIKYIQKRQDIEVVDSVQVDNPYGIINIIPIYWKKRARSQWGISYLNGIANLNEELNELYSGVSRILQYHSAPALIVKGAAKAEVTMGVDRILYLPKDASAEYLTWNQDIKAFNTQIEKIESLISEKSGIPAPILNMEVPSGLSSLSLKVLYTPVISLVTQQRSLWEYNIVKIYEFSSLILNKTNDVKIEWTKAAVIPDTLINTMEDLIKAKEASLVDLPEAKKYIDG